jgi:hypothetical protein
MNTNITPKIFSLDFNYRRAERFTEPYPNLETFMRIIDRRNDENNVDETYPLSTTYYRYQENIVILYEENDVYYCLTYTNGKRDNTYEVLRQRDELEEFFERCGKNVTILENDLAFALKPKFDAVVKYAESMAKAREITNQHRNTIAYYYEKLDQFLDESKDVVKSHEKSAYNDALALLKSYTSVLDSMAYDMRNDALRYTKRCPLNDGYDTCRMFGLFVTALKYGIEKGRYTKNSRNVFNRIFREMVREMHSFMKNNEGIVDRYCQYMHLPANERAYLEYLLESEGLKNKEWGYIGDDIF